MWPRYALEQADGPKVYLLAPRVTVRYPASQERNFGASSMGNVCIGTSGWQYSNWRGSFYPENLPQKDWLRYYSKYFETVEVNSSFYRQTRASTFKKWQEETPPGFTFAVKGNRFITHIKRLKDCEEPLKVFFENVRTLLDAEVEGRNRLVLQRKRPNASRLDTVSDLDRTRRATTLPASKHAILWQLPPSLKLDILRLEEFLKLLPKNFRHAFEFRHESWIDKDTFLTLLHKGVKSTIVFQDWKDWPRIMDYMDVIGLHGLDELPFIYLRFHGKDVLYTSNYTDEELKDWAGKIKKWLKEGKDVYAYFNNDAAGYAIPNALTLKRWLNR